jgi:hypothetical protein
MKAEELRIGNWINDTGEDGGFYQVYGIYPPSNGFESYSISYRNGYFRTILEDGDYDYIQPIPLTEEWLLKFGFEWKNHAMRLGDFCIRQQIDGWIIYLSNESYNKSIKLKFFHQLQNLFYYICGEELKIIDNERNLENG